MRIEGKLTSLDIDPPNEKDIRAFKLVIKGRANSFQLSGLARHIVGERAGTVAVDDSETPLKIIMEIREYAKRP